MRLWFLAAILVVIGFLLYRRRLAAGRRAGQLSDDLIRRLERGESIEVDEPLDQELIREEEERFWDESWDEPEEF